MGNSNFRIMCIDYGDVRFGIALTDLTQTIASPYENYTRKTISYDLQHLKDIAIEKNVKKIVFGLAYGLDSKENKRTIKTREFAEQLKSLLDVEIDYFDERFTSLVAERMLISADISRCKRKLVLDKLSATIILQDYMNKKE